MLIWTQIWTPYLRQNISGPLIYFQKIKKNKKKEWGYPHRFIKTPRYIEFLNIFKEFHVQNFEWLRMLLILII